MIYFRIVNMDTLLWIYVCLQIFCNVDAGPLGSYVIEDGSITVSGLNSGADFAVQMHVAYSSTISGMGSFGGIAYFCAGSSSIQGGVCKNGDGPSAAQLASDTLLFQDAGKIDTSLALRNTRLFLLHGNQDSLVAQSNREKLSQYYINFLLAVNMKSVLFEGLAHGWPTEDYGEPCNTQSSTLYINDCGYHGAYEMLNWLYEESLVKSSSETVTNGILYEYDQREFLVGANLDDMGYVYVPQECDTRNYECKLHVHFHGCSVGRSEVGDEYVTHTFLNQVAELNRMIILYPQVVPDNDQNPDGCWDYVGYSDSGSGTWDNYVTQLGQQMSAVYSMIKRVAPGITLA